MRGRFVVNGCAVLLLISCAKSHPARVEGEPVWLAHCNGGQCGSASCAGGSCLPATHVQGSAEASARRAPPRDAGTAYRPAAHGDAGAAPAQPGRAHDGCVPTRDAGCPVEDIGPWLSALAGAEATWRQFNDGSAPYWYEEMDCADSGPRAATLVQVEHDVARIVARRTPGPDECATWARRREPFTPHTMGELIGACEDLVRREGTAVRIQRDERGVLIMCLWESGSDCSDACGEGFVVERWSFGRAPVSALAGDAGVRRGDGG